MKKQYKAPVCETMEIDTQDIIATSPGISGNGYSDPTQEGLSKSFDFSEEDDEEYL